MEKPILRIRLMADDEQPVRDQLAVADLMRDHSLNQARALCKRLLEGKLVTREQNAQEIVILSCPAGWRADLTEQVRDQFEGKASKEHFKGLAAWQRDELAKTATEPALLELLAQDRRTHRVRATVAGNPATDPRVLATLTDDAHREVRLAVLGNPSLPDGLIDTLASDPDDEVRRKVAASDKVMAPTLKTLTHDTDKRVQLAALSNERLPQEDFDERVAQLLKGSASDRRVVARCPRTPLAILEDLLTDPDKGEAFSSPNYGTVSSCARHSIWRKTGARR